MRVLGSVGLASGGSAVVKGFCSYEDGQYIFETGKPAATTAVQAVKIIAKRDAGLTIHARIPSRH